MLSNTSLFSQSTPQDQKILLINQAQSVFNKIKDLTNATDIHSLLNMDPTVKKLLLGSTHTFENGDMLALSSKLVTNVFKLMIKVNDEVTALKIFDDNENVKAWLANKNSVNPLPAPTLVEIKAILHWQIHSQRREISILKALANNTRLEFALKPEHLPFNVAIQLFNILITHKLSNLAFLLWDNHTEIQNWYFGRPRGMQVLQESELQKAFISLLDVKNAKLLIGFWQDNIVLHRSILPNYLSIIKTVIEKTTKDTLPFFNVFIDDIEDVSSLEKILSWLNSETGKRMQAKQLLCRNALNLRIQRIKTGPQPNPSLYVHNSNRNIPYKQTLICSETKNILEQLSVYIESNQMDKARNAITNYPFFILYLAGEPLTIHNKSSDSAVLQLTPEGSLKYFTTFVEWKATDLIVNFWKAASKEVKLYIAGIGPGKISDTTKIFQLFKALLILKQTEIALHIFNHNSHLKDYMIHTLETKEISLIFGKAVQQKIYTLAYFLWIERPSLKESICTTMPPANIDALISLLSFLSALESGNLYEIAAIMRNESIIIKTCLSFTLNLPKLEQLAPHKYFYISASAYQELSRLVYLENLTDTIELDVQQRDNITFVKITVLNDAKYTDLLAYIVEAKVKSRFSETAGLIAQYVSTETNVECALPNENLENRSIENLFEENIALPEDVLKILTDTNLDGMCEPEFVANVKPKSPSQLPASPSLYGFGYGYQNDSYKLPDYQPINESSTEEQAYKRIKLGN